MKNEYEKRARAFLYGSVAGLIIALVQCYFVYDSYIMNNDLYSSISILSVIILVSAVCCGFYFFYHSKAKKEDLNKTKK